MNVHTLSIHNLTHVQAGMSVRSRVGQNLWFGSEGHIEQQSYEAPGQAANQRKGSAGAANSRVAWWPLMEVPPLASSLNNSAGGKMADIQHCRHEQEEGEGGDGCRRAAGGCESGWNKEWCNKDKMGDV